MGVTVTRVLGPVSIGDRYMTVSTCLFDSSYPTGGEAVSHADLGFAATVDPEFHAVAHASGGYVCEYDHTNKKILVYQQTDPAAVGGANVPLVEVTDTGSLSTLTIRVTAYGKYRA